MPLCRGRTFAHMRADPECWAGVQPVITAFSNQQPEGECLVDYD